MIEQADSRLVAWVQEVLPGVGVAIDAFADADVCLQLLELAERPPARTGARTPLQLALTYLVTTTGDDAHRRLGELMFAALEHDELEVGPAALDGAFWTAAGIAPRAAFRLTVPLRKERTQPAVKPVLEPLRIEGAGVRPLAGVVLGPRDTPIPDALVEIPLLRLSTRSDDRGRFRFTAVPADLPQPHRLRVRAKAHEFPFTIANPTGDEPVALRIDPTRG